MERILGAVVAEHQNEGYSSMKLALSAAVQGKNATITNDGYYTLAQRVFEHEVKFPGLTEEEEAASFAEALGTEGEVARAHEMRMTARMALLRTDVQEKLRRAVLSVLRKPHKRANRSLFQVGGFTSGHLAKHRSAMCLALGVVQPKCCARRRPIASL